MKISKAFKSPKSRDFLFYSSIGLLNPVLTFLASFIVAFSFGASLRGQLAYFFSILNFLVSLLGGNESGAIRVNSSRSIEVTSNERIFFLMIRNICFSFLTLLFVQSILNIEIGNILVMSVAAGLCSGMVIKSQQLLSLKRKLSALWSTSGVWILYLLLLIVLVLLNPKLIDVDQITGIFCLAAILASITIVRAPRAFYKRVKNKDELEFRERTILTLSSLGTILQLNGLILILKPFVSFALLGTISMSLSFLNGALAASFSLVNRFLWERKAFKNLQLFSFWFISVMGFLLFAQCAQYFLESEFKQIVLIICVLLPFYSAIYFLETYIMRNYHIARYQLFSLVKFGLISCTLISMQFFFVMGGHFTLFALFIFGMVYLLLSLLGVVIIQSVSTNAIGKKNS